MPKYHHGLLERQCDHCDNFKDGVCIVKGKAPLGSEIWKDEYVDIDHYVYENDSHKGATICIMPSVEFISRMTWCGIFERYLIRTVEKIINEETHELTCCKICPNFSFNKKVCHPI